MRVLEELRLPGVQVRRSGGMLRMGLPDGAVVRLATVAARSTSPLAVRALLEAREGRDEVTLVIADRVSAQLRERLCEQGVGWLDRRGHLRLVHGGLVIDTDVPSLLPPSPAGTLLPRDPCTTSVGREVALELLVAPEQTPTVRGLARALGRAPSSVSSVLRALRGQGLVDDQRRAVNPDLFWALAAGWLPHRYSLRRCPDPTDPDDDWSYELHAADLDVPGWALSDTRAAVALGVPLLASGDYPPDLYVPDERILMRAMQHFGESAVANSRACTLAVAPAPMVCTRRYANRGPWPLAHPVVVALDLAADPGRGSEALDAWDPEDAERVW
jgi:DNA-binding transcriptional ArsR family regulator